MQTPLAEADLKAGQMSKQIAARIKARFDNNRTIIGDSPNAVHLMIIGTQQYLLFMGSFPFLGKYCFVRRLTTRGLDRPLGLV